MIQALIEKAHETFKHSFSIETQMVHETPQTEWAAAVCKVTTEKGVYNGWSMGPVEAFNELVEQATIQALCCAGITLLPANVLQQRTSPQAPAPVSVFQTRDETPTSAETAQECANGPHPITDYYAGSVVIPALEVAARTLERHGKAICAECSSATIRRRTRKAAAETPTDA